jgi:hypothetical protein
LPNGVIVLNSVPDSNPGCAIEWEVEVVGHELQETEGTTFYHYAATGERLTAGAVMSKAFPSDERQPISFRDWKGSLAPIARGPASRGGRPDGAASGKNAPPAQFAVRRRGVSRSFCRHYARGPRTFIVLGPEFLAEGVQNAQLTRL